MEDDFLSRVKSRETVRKSGKRRALMGGAVAVVLFGSAVAGYYVFRDDVHVNVNGEAVEIGTDGDERQALAAAPTPSPSASEAEAVTAAANRVEKVAEQQGGLEARVVAMEQRLSQLDLQTQAASGNAARAEGLLIAFATRRAIERGEPLGYLTDQLKLRFGDAQPKAVQTVIDAAKNPVTLDKLIARLEGLAPKLRNEAQEEVSWQWFKRELSELFVVRREASPSPQPERRLERARLFLESGRIEAAVAEVRNLPGADEARQWIADAERYAAAQRALDRLETTAILEPRNLRDSEGSKVEQPSPAKDNN